MYVGRVIETFVVVENDSGVVGERKKSGKRVTTPGKKPVVFVEKRLC